MALYPSYDQWDHLWRGWVASSTIGVTSPRTWHGLHTFRLRSRKPGKDCTICDKLRKFRVSPTILKTFYSGAIESVLTQCISVWYGNSSNRTAKALQRVVRLAECISGSALPSLQDIYFKSCKSRAAKILKDSTHPGNHLFCLLPSGKRFRSMMAKLRDWGGASSLRPSGSLTQTQSHKHYKTHCLL